MAKQDFIRVEGKKQKKEKYWIYQGRTLHYISVEEVAKWMIENLEGRVEGFVNAWRKVLEKSNSKEAKESKSEGASSGGA